MRIENKGKHQLVILSVDVTSYPLRRNIKIIIQGHPTDRYCEISVRKAYNRLRYSD